MLIIRRRREKHVLAIARRDDPEIPSLQPSERSDEYTKKYYKIIMRCCPAFAIVVYLGYEDELKKLQPLHIYQVHM